MTTRLALSLASLIESGYLMARMTGPEADGRMPAIMVRAIGVLLTEGSMGVTALSRRCHVSQPAMTDAVGRAVAAGWLQRSPSSARMLEVTDEGRALRRTQREADGTALEPHFRRLGDRERATLERAAMILASGLEQERH